MVKNIYRHLTLSLERNVAHVRLNRPPVNALNWELVQELRAVASEVSRNPDVWTVELGSIGKTFCAGADLKERALIDDSRVAVTVRRIQRMVQAWVDIPQPVIAGIQGAALGGGLELALSADIIAASDLAELGLPEVGLGIIPAAGGTQLLARRCSMGVASKWILSGSRFTADDARRDGVVDYVFSADSFSSALAHLVAQIASRSPLALIQAKRALYHPHRAELLRGMRHEGECYAKLIRTQDRREALRAFMAGEKPVWQRK